MSELLHVSSSPHVRDKVNTGNIMLTAVSYTHLTLPTNREV